MNRNKFKLTILIVISVFSQAMSQSNQVNDGKMDTVIYVYGIVLAGFFVYLFYIDRKISKIENHINNE